MDAIVFKSNTGYTQKYAELLAKKINLKSYDLEEAKKVLAPNSKIIFLGWLCASKVMGLNEAQKQYEVQCVCAVGMGAFNEEQRKKNAQQNKWIDEEFFLLQGGFDINKLHGLYRFMMKMMINTVGKSVEKKENKTEEEIEMLDMMKNGGDKVSEEALLPVVEFVSNLK